MKKLVIISFLLAFMLQIVLAQPLLEIDERIQPQEIILGKITTTGEFESPIFPSQIEMFEGRKQVFFDKDITFYDGQYFMYILFDREGNFTLKINNILYKEESIKSKTIEKQIIVEKEYLDENKTKSNILSIDPGFIFTSREGEIILKNKGDMGLNFTYTFEEQVNELNLPPLGSKKILVAPTKTFSFLKVDSYKTFQIPIIYIPLEPGNNLINQERIGQALKSNPTYLQIKVIEGEDHSEVLELFNFAEENLTDMVFETDSSVIDFESIEFMGPKSTKNLTLKFDSKNQGFFIDELIVKYIEGENQGELRIPLEVYIFPENTPLENLERTGESCDDLRGKVCASTFEECDTEIKFTGQHCCLGKCLPVGGDDTSYGWIWGIGIIVLLVVVGLFVFKKYRKSKPKGKDEKLKEISKDYEKRVKGKITKN
jgi:hypothetical protein